jgi:AraC-like DNA-binding protein
MKNINIYELPFEEKDRSFQIYEVQGKRTEDAKYLHDPSRPHRHNYYEICVFITGAGKHEVDFKSFPIISHSIHFLSPGQVHMISREENYHGYLLMFNREFYSSDFQKKDMLFELPFFNNNTSKPILELNAEEFQEFTVIIDSLKRENERDHELKINIVRSFLHIFLLKCKVAFLEKRIYTGAIEDLSYNTVNRFKLLLEKSYKELHLVKEYADALGITPIQLNKMVKAITGKNASDMIINRIILESKRLLTFTELSNKEIAFQMNYDDPSYFSRIFRKKQDLRLLTSGSN